VFLAGKLGCGSMGQIGALPLKKFEKRDREGENALLVK